MDNDHSDKSGQSAKQNAGAIGDEGCDRTHGLDTPVRTANLQSGIAIGAGIIPGADGLGDGPGHGFHHTLFNRVKNLGGQAGHRGQGRVCAGEVLRGMG